MGDAARQAPAETGAGPARAAAPRPAGTPRDDALFGLSEPASPRDALPAETADFVPASHGAQHHAPAKPVLDDFDRLIASEMAVLGHGQRPGAPATAQGEAGFSDYDIDFADLATSGGTADAYEDEAPRVLPAAATRRRAPATGGVRQGMKFVSGVAGVALLSIAAAVAWNSFFGTAGGGGDALVVAADPQPYKTRPEDPGGRVL